MHTQYSDISNPYSMHNIRKRLQRSITPPFAQRPCRSPSVEPFSQENSQSDCLLNYQVRGTRLFHVTSTLELVTSCHCSAVSSSQEAPGPSVHGASMLQVPLLAQEIAVETLQPEARPNPWWLPPPWAHRKYHSAICDSGNDDLSQHHPAVLKKTCCDRCAQGKREPQPVNII